MKEEGRNNPSVRQRLAKDEGVSALMGCRGSKSRKGDAASRVAQYQKESWAAERAVSRYPEPLDWETSHNNCISPHTLHNLLSDGFYAPFAANPLYVLLIDCRDARAFTRRRVAGAHWHGALSAAPEPESCFYVILYDDKPRIEPPESSEPGPLPLLFHDLQRRGLQPLMVTGGWTALEVTSEHLMGPGSCLPWYPALVVPGLLYIGHADTATDAGVLKALRVTHVVAVSDTVPRRAFPALNYLVVPLPDGSLVSSIPILTAFVSEAQGLGTCVLVYCDTGLSRAAALVMALLMAERRCSLEDAFYCVRRSRSALAPAMPLLRELIRYEEVLFGAQITEIDDLY